MKYSFGLRGHDIADNFDDMCSVASNNNICEIQFAMAKTIKDINFYSVGYNTEISERVRKKLNENNLKVSVMGCYINPVNQDIKLLEKDLNLFKNFLLYAKDFEATVIGTETGSMGNITYTHSKENYLFFLNNLSPLICKAEDIGVMIGVEPVWYDTISSPIVMNRMLKDAKSENIGVILDVANMISEDNRDKQCDVISQAFELFADKIKTIHLKDFTFENGEKKIVLAGTGELDINYLFDKIEEYDVDCQFILDETRIEDYNQSLRMIKSILNI